VSGFGSYQPAEVTWLLTNLSDVQLEVPTEDREELIQGGRPYYEMLPVEYEPLPAYLALFHQSLRDSADRLAVAVGVVSELVLAGTADPDGPVLVSLARAGTPIGILIRRWLAARRQLDAQHYTISIVRGAGIDEVALDHILSRHRPEQVRFVDGWTGKGAIARELAVAVAAYTAGRPDAAGLDDELAVLADPGSCTSLYGTRDDFLIPSACLNSTVSGLVSRTVLRPDLIRPGMFHGAKFYSDLADADVSGAFLDAVSSRFAAVSEQVQAGVAAHLASDTAPTWAGWAALEPIAAEFGIDNLNLVKPGVGETTRVLLRRVPWQILVRPDRAADLRHVLLLAEARGVPTVERPDLPYSCVGLIKPAGRR
jgi:Phosphoribosyl transferase (PRTase)/PELOTA RNA binding domain